MALRLLDSLSPNDRMNAKLAIDCLVLLLYFFIIIAIGLRMGRKEATWRISRWAAGKSRGGPSSPPSSRPKRAPGRFLERRAKGLLYAITLTCSSPSAPSLRRILVSYIFIKPYYDYKVFSIYEYLTARFGVATKNAASAVFMFTRLLASGARLYVAAIALALAYEMIRGVRPTQAETLWIYVGATIAIVILTAIYTTLGGIKAVIWTDLIQASIMIGSALAALGLLYFAIPGGWHEIVQRQVHSSFPI